MIPPTRLHALALLILLALPSCVAPIPASRPDRAIVSGAGMALVLGMDVAEPVKSSFLAPRQGLFRTHVTLAPGPQMLMFTCRRSLSTGMGTMTMNTHFAHGLVTMQPGHTYQVTARLERDKSKNFFTTPAALLHTVIFQLQDTVTKQILVTAKGTPLMNDPEFDRYLSAYPELAPLMRAGLANR